MKYGFIDESGSPGVAMHEKDYLLVSMVIFDTEKSINQAKEAIIALRRTLGLSLDYEFHCNKNSTRSQTAFIELISTLRFNFVTLAIRKDDFRSTATYAKIARALIGIVRDNFSEIRIEMDSNPTLYSEIKKQIKQSRTKSIKIYQSRSHGNDMIQIADYIANLSAKRLKGAVIAKNNYYKIASKEMVFKII